MRVIIYVSDYTLNSDPENTLNDIVKVAKINNPTLDITGVLFFHNNRFLQLIEGKKENLDKLLNKLKQDPRHNNISVIVDEAVNNRSFADWNMDYFDLSGDQQIKQEVIETLKEQFCHTCQLDAWLFIQVIKDALKTYTQTT